MRDGEFLEKDEQKRKDREVATKMQNSVGKRMTRNGVKFVQLVKWRGFLTKSGGKTRRT